jgi:hypothetical protein
MIKVEWLAAGVSYIVGLVDGIEFVDSSSQWELTDKKEIIMTKYTPII